MGSPLGLWKVPRSLFFNELLGALWLSFWVCTCIACWDSSPLGLLVESLLGGCRCLAWLLLVMKLLVLMVMRFLVGRFTGLVVLVRDGKRIRLNRKTLAHLPGLEIECRPRVWKRLRQVEHPLVSIPDSKIRRRRERRLRACLEAPAVQPNPSYPALCRQDTTSPWSTDYGGNSETLILMPAVQHICKRFKEKEKKKLFLEKMKKKKKKEKVKKKKKFFFSKKKKDERKKGRDDPKRYLLRRLKNFFLRNASRNLVAIQAKKYSHFEQARKEKRRRKMKKNEEK